MAVDAHSLRIRARTLAPLLLILLATTLVYLPGMGGGFIFDDFQNLLANRSIAMGDAEHQSWLAAMFSSPASDLQRPLAMLTFAINHYFGGFDSRQMKATNLAIHLLNVLLVFALVRGLARDALAGDEERARRVALFTSACWALHPINLMAVLYVVQRMESLCHTFVFIGLLMYAAGRRRQMAGRWGWSLILGGLGGGTLLGLACKESAVLLPLYALLAELTIFRGRGAGGARQRGLPTLYLLMLVLPGVLGVAWLLPRSLNPATWATRNFDLGERLLTEGRVLVDYLHWSVLPDLRSLSLYHDDYVVSRGWLQPPSTLLAYALLAGLAALAWAMRRRRPLLALGIAWFFAAQALTATIVPLELVFEHRNYFASVGICLAIADLCMLPAEAGPRRALGMALATCFALFLAGTTWLRADEWSSPIRFAETEAAKHPASPRATYELARLLIIAGNYDRNSPFTARAWPALETAMRAPGSDALPYQAALMLAARTGRPLRPEWWRGMQRSLRDNPAKPQNQLALIALDNCSLEEICELPPSDMLATFNAALEKGDQPGILSIFGKYALQQLGDHELGLRLWREAARLDPGNAQFRINLAMLYSDLDRPEDARRELAALRRLGHFEQYRDDADALERRLPPAIDLDARAAMKRWRERHAARALALSKSLVVRQMSWLVLARLFQIGANVASTLVMARVLGPERLGLLSLATTIAVVMASIGTLGLEQIAMREFASEGEAGTAHATRSLLLLRLAGALLAGLLVLAMLLVPLPQAGALGPLLVVLALLPLFQGGDIAEWRLVANQRGRAVAQATMASALLFAIGKITLALVHPDLFAFALAVLAEAALRSLLLAWASRGLWAPHRPGNASLAMAGQFLREGGPLLASTIAIFLYIRLDQFMIASMVGARAVGQFVAVANVSEMQLVAAMALSRSVMPSLVQAFERSPADFEALLSRCMRAGFYLMVASSVLLSLASPWLLALMFGPGYEGGARALSIHAFMAPFAMLGVLSSNWFVLNRNTGHALGRTLFGAVVNVVLNLLLIPRMGIAGAAVATLCAQVSASLLYDAFAADTRGLFKLKLRALLPAGR